MGNYSYYQKFFRNAIALLGEPAVAPGSQSVITFENCFTEKALFGSGSRAVPDGSIAGPGKILVAPPQKL